MVRLFTIAAVFTVAACGSRTAAEPQGAGALPAAKAPLAEAPAPATPIADEYRAVAGRIIEAAIADRGAWEKISVLTDQIGHRLSGSKSLERAIAWAAQALEEDGHEAVRTQAVKVPHWVRGKESAELLSPARHELHILGLGNSVGTPAQGITAEVVEVRDFDALDALGEGVAGKIVFFNHPLPPYSEEEGAGYDKAVAFRTRGASRAARLGARAVLVRSITATSLRSAHTGALRYEEGVAQIPGAAVTIEDAELISRLLAGGHTVTARLSMEAKNLGEAASANVIGELRGRERPEEIVLIGAHIDSWDVGQGAHDNAAGCAIVMQALTILRRLDLRPRRTIRVVLFTNEENGLRGAIQYAADHAEAIGDHVMALESDSGGFAPRGFAVESGDMALAHATEIASLLEPIGASQTRRGFSGADLIPLVKAEVPSLGLWVEGSRYFDYHHSHADTLDKVDPEHLARNVAAVAVMAYVVADMPERFGGERGEAAPPGDAATP